MRIVDSDTWMRDLYPVNIIPNTEYSGLRYFDTIRDQSGVIGYNGVDKVESPGDAKELAELWALKYEGQQRYRRT